ncbi:hypothetical protein [Geodermatophilus sp. URMC 63]
MPTTPWTSWTAAKIDPGAELGRLEPGLDALLGSWWTLPAGHAARSLPVLAGALPRRRPVHPRG